MIGILVDVGKSLSSVVGSAVSIDLDVTSSEAHELRSDVTTSPVEVGSPVADHIQLQADRLTLTGFITDAPISPELSPKFSGGIDGSISLTRVQTTFDLLRALHEKRELVTIYTRYLIYRDMAITSISIPRNANNGDSVQFTIDLVKVRIVSTQTTDVPPGITAKPQKLNGGTKKSAQTQKKQGAVQNKKVEPKEAEKKVSFLKSLRGNNAPTSVASVGF